MSPTRASLLDRLSSRLVNRSRSARCWNPGRLDLREHRLGPKDIIVGTTLLEIVDSGYREALGGRKISNIVFIGRSASSDPPRSGRVHPDRNGRAVTVTAATSAPYGRMWTSGYAAGSSR